MLRPAGAVFALLYTIGVAQVRQAEGDWGLSKF